MANKNSIEQTTLLRMGSSLFIRSVAISAKTGSPRVLTLFTLYSSFSLKPTGFHEIFSTFSFKRCSLPTFLMVSTFILLILGTCSLKSLLLMVLTLVQSFLTVSSLNLVLYWLCQVLNPLRCFLVKVRVLATLFFLLSPILMFLEMQSLLVTLVFPSTTVNSSSSLRVGAEARLQHLICALLNRLKKESGMCQYYSWVKVQSIHYLSSILKSQSRLRSIYIVDLQLMIILLAGPESGQRTGFWLRKLFVFKFGFDGGCPPLFSNAFEYLRYLSLSGVYCIYPPQKLPKITLFLIPFTPTPSAPFYLPDA